MGGMLPEYQATPGVSFFTDLHVVQVHAAEAVIACNPGAYDISKMQEVSENEDSEEECRPTKSSKRSKRHR